MTVRFIFSCPRCCSMSIRPSTLHLFGDSLRTSLAFRAYRCRMCRLRFYLFKPARLQALLSMLDRPAFVVPRELHPRNRQSAHEAGKAPGLTAWDLLRQNRFW